MFKRLFYIALRVMLRKYVDLRYTNTILTETEIWTEQSN